MRAASRKNGSGGGGANTGTAAFHTQCESAVIERNGQNLCRGKGAGKKGGEKKKEKEIFFMYTTTAGRS